MQRVASKSGLPALAGLGVPHWGDHATGTITGMTYATAKAHQIADVFDAMEQDIGSQIAELRADGGGSANDFLMQLQADCLGRRVLRSDIAEIGAIGVAAMALNRPVDLEADRAAAMSGFDPRLSAEQRQDARARWAKALVKAR
jgi:glycerol kinase